MSSSAMESSYEETKRKDKKKKHSKTKKKEEKEEDQSKRKDTIITPDHGYVPEEYKKYYALEYNEELQDLFERFIPSDDEIWIFQGTPKCHRMIYPVNDDGYEEDEEEKYQDFVKYLKDNDFEHFDMFRKRDLMRILEGMDWKNKEGLAETLLNVEFKKTLPIILDEKTIKCLDSGLYYSHGRDRNLRPVMIFCPKVVVTQKIELEDAITATHFVSQYLIDHMMYEGKVENYLTILDSANLSFTALPKMWIVTFVKTFNHYYYQRNVCMAVLNVHWTIRAIYAINQFLHLNLIFNPIKFIHPTTRQKIIFEASNTCDALTDRVDPYQLEQKYGGEAENLTKFWPPHIDSNNYGIERHKLAKPKKKSKGKNKESGENSEVDADNIHIQINPEIEVPNPDEAKEQTPRNKNPRKVDTKKGCGCGCAIF